MPAWLASNKRLQQLKLLPMNVQLLRLHLELLLECQD